MMKNLRVFSLTGLILFGGSLMGATLQPTEARTQMPKRTELSSANFNGETLKVAHNRRHLQKMKPMGAPEVIENAEGQKIQYSRSAEGLFVFYGELMDFYDDAAPGTIVWGENNEVYFYNILAAQQTDTYAKGTLAGETITVPMGQTLLWIDDDPDYDPYGINLGVLKLFHGSDEWMGDYFSYELDDSIENVTYTLNADGSLSLNLPGDPYEGGELPEYVLGFYYSDDLEWIGCVDFYQEWEIAGEMTELPEDATLNSYIFINEYFQNGSIVDVAFYGDDLYIRGLSNQFPEGIVKARVEGDKAYIPQDQIIGIAMDLFFIYTKCIIENPYYDPDDWDSEEYMFAPEDVCYVLEIDRENMVITSAEQEAYLCFNYYKNMYFPMDEFENINLVPGTYGVGNPADPFRLSYVTMLADWMGYNYIGFTQPNITVDNQLLNSENLYYRIYINGDLKVFEEEWGINLIGEEVLMYMDVDGPTDLLSSEFSNYEDIEAMGGTVIVGFYEEGIETVGVQSVYLDGDKEYCSYIVTIDTATREVTTGINGVETTTAIDNNYYDLYGRRVANPTGGIFIHNGKKIIKR